MLSLNARYGTLMDAWEKVLEQGSILEVGGGTDAAGRHAESIVASLGFASRLPTFARMKIDAGSIAELPYPDGAFDFVVCAGALGHIPGPDRRRAISELLRIARQGCFILGPHGGIAASLDKGLAETLERLGMALPGYLQAHLQNGLPMLCESVQAIQDAGFVPSIGIAEGIIEHCASLPPGQPAPQLRLFKAAARTKGANSAAGVARADVPYSLLITVDKNRPVRGATDPFFAALRAGPASTASDAARDGNEITFYATHHKSTGLLGKFGLIRAFDVTGRLPGIDMSMRDPQGFFETRNDRCSELSAFHYIWKRKLYGDIVGFCHYRRFLYPFPDDIGEPEIRLGPDELAALLPRIEDRDRIVSLLEGHDLLTARPMQLEHWRQEEQYAMVHYADDYYAMVECIVDRQPYLGPAMIESMNARTLYAANMMVCRKELFDVFCRVWFDILSCCADKLEPAGRNAYQTRDIGFLSERVFDTLVRHLKRLGGRVCELPRVFLET